MDISLIIPVYNEGKSIGGLMKSLLTQTLVPKEIIFIDGGSKDGTQEIILGYAKKNKTIKLSIQNKSRKKGKIALARNQGIQLAKNNYIVCADAGCVLSKDWIEKMTLPFKNGYDVVFGNYQPLISCDFDKYQKILSVNEIVDSNNDVILSRASSRAIAFKKECWKSVGGYPEETYTGEDTKYNYSLKEKGYKIAFAKDAVSYWNMRPDVKSFFIQYKKYGFGDIKAGNLLKLKKNFLSFVFVILYLLVFIVSWFFSIWLGLVLLILPILVFFSLGSYLLFSRTNTKENRGYYLKGLFFVPYLLFLKRIGYFFGLVSGVW